MAHMGWAFLQRGQNMSRFKNKGFEDRRLEVVELTQEIFKNGGTTQDAAKEAKRRGIVNIKGKPYAAASISAMYSKYKLYGNFSSKTRAPLWVKPTHKRGESFKNPVVGNSTLDMINAVCISNINSDLKIKLINLISQ